MVCADGFTVVVFVVFHAIYTFRSFCDDVHSLSLCLPVQRGHVSPSLQSTSLWLYMLYLKLLFTCM